MRSMIFAVLALLASGCGRSGDGGLGSQNEGIVSNSGGNDTVVPANGCVPPASQGWTGQHDPFPDGQTGDFCSYGGAAFEGGRGAWCINDHLIMETNAAGASDFCFGDGGTGLPPPVQAGTCVQSCGSSGGSMLDCPTTPVRAPSRQIPSPWQLNIDGDCAALWSACPQVGDACTGTVVCSGFWHPNQPDDLLSFGGENAFIWCDSGSIQIVVHL